MQTICNSFLYNVYNKRTKGVFMFPFIYEINKLEPCNNINYTRKPSTHTNKPTLYLLRRRKHENSLD